MTGQPLWRQVIHGAAPGFDPFQKGAALGDVEVLCPPLRATPSLISTSTPSPTASRTPSATATDTPTRTPFPTATPRPRPIYLPVALREACDVRTVHADVALVIDVSTSMRRPAGDGRPKIEAVQAAASQFVTILTESGRANGHNGQDRVAIVGFNDACWLEQPLTNERSRLLAAVRRLPQRMAEGTRLDRAIDGGVEALSDPGRPEDRSLVMVLMTDGMPNRVPTPVPSGSHEDTVLARADRAKRAGVRIYTIGVGLPNAPDLTDRINPELLRAVASEPGMYYQTWGAEELVAIYRQIAYTIGCPPESFWGRR